MKKIYTGQKQLAAYFGISTVRLKQLIAEGKESWPGGHGIHLTPDLLPFDEKRRRYLPVSEERAAFIKSSIIALAAERPDAKQDVATGKIIGKEYRTRQSDLGIAPRPRPRRKKK